MQGKIMQKCAKKCKKMKRYVDNLSTMVYFKIKRGRYENLKNS